MAKAIVLFIAAAALIGVAVVPGIYGLVLAFKASLILGMIAMIVEPSPVVLGWVAIFGHSDLCGKIATWLHLPF